jgi:putative tryptophan/tyrosine transport system substrate-binding protein
VVRWAPGPRGFTDVGTCRPSLFAPLALRVAQVGYLTGTGPANLAYAPQYEAFRSAMNSYGWTEGENLTITVRYANGDVAQLPELVAELLSLPLDVLVAIGTNSAVEAKHATATLPIVNIAGSDPLAQGLVASLAHPGGNLTGNTAAVSNTTPTAKQLDLLKALVPGLARVAALVNAAGSSATVGYPLLACAATSVGIDLVRLEVRSSSDFGAAFAQARDSHA